jgi:hypothetical protein
MQKALATLANIAGLIAGCAPISTSQNPLYSI